MNCRQRFLATLHNGKPDRIPILANLTVQVAEKLAPLLQEEIGNVDSFLATRISHRDILCRLGNDAVIVAATRGNPTITLENGNLRDEWGLEYQQFGLYSEAVKRPLANCNSRADLDQYPFPDPNAPQRWEDAARAIRKYGTEYGIVGDLEACLFELSWNLVGMEKFLIDLCSEEEYVTALLDRVLDYSRVCGRKMIAMGVDLIWAGDDFGTQTGMMIAPGLWRSVFLPRIQAMFSEFKRLNPHLKIAYHSCGAIAPIIPGLIEAGLDFLNPIQPLAAGMDLHSLYREYAGRLGFFGGVDVQGVLPHGTVEEVRREVRRCIDAVEHSGRFIIAPAHNIQPDTPVENVFAFFEEVKSYGIL